MKKIINNPNDILNQAISGYVAGYKNLVKQLDNLPIVIRKNKKQNKVALISGGGSGHEPAHLGYVGYGMLDAAVCGDIFTSPSADKIYEAIKATNSNKGVLLIIKNYSGDVMNFEMAAEIALAENIDVKKVIVNDDIAVENSTYTIGRRGVAGTVLVHKILGAAAELDYSLEQLEELGNNLVSNIKTIGMAIKPCYVPTSQKLSFDLNDNEIEMGVGIHGEPGIQKEKFSSADDHVAYMMNKLLTEFEFNKNDEIAVMINGLGATTNTELFIVNNKVSSILSKHQINVYKTFINNYMTSLDMEGFSITLCKLNKTTKALLDHKSDAGFFKV
ncbi:dihydroxyacetone kinase subunit DhaK [Mycoplasma sp. E35C]|uniref:dihydroxyacetone kinase subunit DhaK n=1 Tax=Mycoplasma sp. E35C TaxID=2801918 RepID=UPI001CA3E92C|nr:dihydroxyacetone kinase subunit DhaK [Mycoplasma sp. E35C]QZX48865.1 dihydroxyacetone kinase subunit DhaK [Mycoplasma sp. E35C]